MTQSGESLTTGACLDVERKAEARVLVHNCESSVISKSMLDYVKRQFRELKASPPGRRFQELYRRRQNVGRMRKPLVIAGGLALIVIGIVLLVIPGPGTIFLVGGVALTAQELLCVARALDWLELRGRKWWRRRRAASAAHRS
jgi:hypothetical protein